MSSLWNNDSDYHETEDVAPSFTPGSMITMAMLSLTFLLGLPGNAIVIWVTGLKMKRTVNTTWFLNLAVADFLCCLSLPFSIAQVALHGHWHYGNILCKFLPSVIIFNMFASVFILVAISLDRCLLVIKPVWSQNHRTVGMASGLCLGIWFLAFLMCVPVFIYREKFTTYEGKIVCGYNYGSDFNPYFDYDYLEEFTTTTEVSPLDHLTISTEQMPTAEDIRNLTPLDIITHTTAAPKEKPGATSGFNSLIETALTNNVESPVAHAKVPISRPLAITFQDILNQSSLDKVTQIQQSGDKISSATTHRPKTRKSFVSFDSSRTPGGMSAVDFTLQPTVHPDYDSEWEDVNYGLYEDMATPVPLTVITFTRLIFGFAIPLTIIIVCYAFILQRVKGAHFSKSGAKMLRVVFIIVSAFFVCWAPYHIIGVFLLYYNSPTLVFLDSLSQCLAYTNSCINPVLYVFSGQDFKEKLRKSVRAVFESAFSEEITRSTAPTRSRNSTDGNLKITSV
ncbi:C3a anaphylatoxin chemotactic receptor-like [Lissotriton helveticus]